MVITRLFLTVGIIFCGGILCAQEHGPAKLIAVYTEHFAHQLYQGKLYGTYPTHVLGHQSYGDLGVVEGSSIVFDGVQYDDVPLMFDLVRNQVVTRHPVHMVNIVLPNELISSFTIGASRFVYLDEPAVNLPSGFYELISQTPTLSCYARWTKEYREDRHGTRLSREFVGQVEYYLNKVDEGGDYIAIRNQATLLRSFRSQRRSLRRALFDQGLSFKERPEATLKFVLDHVANTD